MVLVDTSLWIRYLYGQAAYRPELDRLLAGDEVAGHDLIYGELLIGDCGGRRRFLSDYTRMHHANIVPHHEVVALVRHRALHGRGIGWIDVHLLASALAGGLQFWTADAPLAAIAKDLGIAYK